jgi:hypothetical protein
MRLSGGKGSYREGSSALHLPIFIYIREVYISDI